MNPSLHIAELLRPDDLLDLILGVVGDFELDTSSSPPVLRRGDSKAPAYLLVVFGAQWIGEQAYLETDAVPNPGSAKARINGLSWLTFEIPDSVTEIEYTAAGLLDWSALRPLVSPLVEWAAGGPHDGSPPPIVRPGIAVTALQLPYRLVMSPGPQAGWQHPDQPVTFGGRTELWHTRLAVDATAPLWAIWSPDYPLLLSDSDPAGDPSTSSTPRQRAELVGLTVGFGLPLHQTGSPIQQAPVRARRLWLSALGAWLEWNGRWQPEKRVWLGGAFGGLRANATPLRTAPSASAGPQPKQPAAAKRVPAEAVAGTHIETAVPSATLKHLAQVRATLDNRLQQIVADRIARLPPIEVKPGPTTKPGSEDITVNLAAWTQIGTGGRDQYVKIVEVGWLYPFGHQATLTTITERRFEPGANGAPVAYLVQFQYVTVTEPVVAFAGDWSSASTRAMPFASVRLTTRVTPHVKKPPKPPNKDSDPPVGIPGTTGESRPRWLVDEAGNDVQFHAVGADRAGNDVPFTAAMIFIFDSTVEQDPSAVQQVQDSYETSGTRRDCPVPRRHLLFAPPDAPGAQDTELITERLTFESAVSGREFNAKLHQADVRVPAVAHITGKDVAMTVGLYEDYVDKGIDAVHGVFAELETAVRVGFAAQQAGGFAAPNLMVKGLRRGFGPVAGQLDKVADDHFDPADYFDPSAYGGLELPKLFDAIPLDELLQSSHTLGSGSAAPRLTTDVVRDSGGKPVALRAKLEWKPALKSWHPHGSPLALTVNDSTTFSVTATLTTPLDPKTGKPETPTTDVLGELKNKFEIKLAGVVNVRFESFTIHSASGQKPEVKLKLVHPHPVEFEGGLDFVNALAELFPPGGLSDPPYVDVSPTGLTAGFGLALPPAEIGVLSLHDLSLDTAFTLPFLSGRPALNLAFSSREHPFVLTVSALGGGGFLHLEFDTTGVVMIEGSFEFGGEFALDIGVASGGVHLMAGIYLRIDKTATPDTSQLTGFVDLSGEVTVLGLVSVSVDFNLSLAYFIEIHKARGRATLTVSISIAFFSTSVSMSVERSFGKGSHDPSAADVFPEYADWQRYAEAFAA